MLSDRLNSLEIDVIDMLNNTAPGAAEAFLSSPDMIKPPNRYDKLDIDRVRKNLAELDEIRDSAEYQGLSSYNRLYADMIVDYYHRQNTFVAACYDHLHSETRQKEVTAERQRQANIRLFGEPDRDIMLSLISEKFDEIRSRELSPGERDEFGRLEELTAELPLDTADRVRFYPSEDTLMRFSEMAEIFYEPLLRHIPAKDEFTTEECAEIVNEILADELIDYRGDWKAVTETGRLNASVNHDECRLKFPAGRIYTPEKMRTIIVHELGVHVMRAMPFRDAGLKAFSFGFPGYEETEEGIAKIMEQGVTRKFQKSGIIHYISIGLAHIMRYDFRKVFEIQKRLQGLSSGTPELLVFNSVQRAFRGTGELSDNKDLVYFNGALRVWRYIAENIDSPDLFDNLLLSAKTDFLSPLQRELVCELKAGRTMSF